MEVETTVQKETADAFDLGVSLVRYQISLKASVTSNGAVSEYPSLRELQFFAQRLGIVLPDELTDLPQERKVPEEVENFLDIQKYYIISCLRSKDQQIENACIAGFVSAHPTFSALFKTKRKLLEEQTTALTNFARLFGVDISPEVQKLRDINYSEQDIPKMLTALKYKLCKIESDKYETAKRSKVSPNNIITDEFWAISLMRLPDRENDEHAFLVLEGKKIIWFFDFVAAKKNDLYLPGIRDGRVRIKKFEPQGTVDSSSELLFRCKEPLMDIEDDDRWLHSTWTISRHTAEILIQNIEAQQQKPPKYNILGDSALAECSATSSSNPTGHNCFTFARKMLLDLKDEHIKLPSDKLGDWIYSATSRTLVDPQLERKKWKAMRFPVMFVCLAGALIIAVIAFIWAML